MSEVPPVLPVVRTYPQGSTCRGYQDMDQRLDLRCACKCACARAFAPWCPFVHSLATQQRSFKWCPGLEPIVVRTRIFASLRTSAGLWNTLRILMSFACMHMPPP